MLLEVNSWSFKNGINNEFSRLEAAPTLLLLVIRYLLTA